MTALLSLRPRIATLTLSFVATTLLAGCAGFDTTATAPATAASVVMSGAVHGGQQAISGSHIYMYGAAATNATYGSAATSLLRAALNTSVDLNGNFYVTTDLNGAFSITGDYNCPSTTAPVYLLAVGGNPGLLPLTTNNSAITLMAVLGPCSGINSGTLANINEVTTVAAATTLQQFMTGPTHVGTSNNNLAGLVNAAASAINIVDRASGFARTTNLLGTGSVPQAKIHALANILSPCINTAGPTSTQCANLFTFATPTGGSAPSDVTTAMLDIAQNPISHVPNLFGLIDANAPFQPTLSTAPNDFTIAVDYSGGNYSGAQQVAIDSLGNAWVTGGGLHGFGPQGAILSGANGFNTNLSTAYGIAIDQENAIWVGDSSSDVVTRLSSNGNTYPGFPYHGLTLPQNIAIDISSNAWVTDLYNKVVHLSNTGTVLFSQTAQLNLPTGIAIDHSGYVYVSNAGSNSIYGLTTGQTFTNGGLNSPGGIAIDHSNNLWVMNAGANSSSEFNEFTPAALSPSGGFPGNYYDYDISIAGDGTVWYANCKGNCSSGSGTGLIHLSATGSYLNTTAGFQDPNFYLISATAIDSGGNVWVGGLGSTLTEFLGVAAPVATPIAVASQYNALGIRP
jgi:streptogramin lyase